MRIFFKFFIEFGYYRKWEVVGCWLFRIYDENLFELLLENEWDIGEGGNSKIIVDIGYGIGELV